MKAAGILPAWALCLLLPGCIGFGVFRSRTETFQDPAIPDTAGLSVSERPPGRTNELPVYTAAWLDAHWGKPKSIRHAGPSGADEVWTYEFGLIWNGFAPIFLTPIPIAVPVAREQVRFVLRDGRVVSAEQTGQRQTGVVAGYVPGICGLRSGVFPFDE
jgi:hypothetical protein